MLKLSLAACELLVDSEFNFDVDSLSTVLILAEILKLVSLSLFISLSTDFKISLSDVLAESDRLELLLCKLARLALAEVLAVELEAL